MSTDPVFVHIDFEGYRPLLMTQVQEQFFLYKLCPPNSKVHYFFSNPIKSIQTVAKDQLIMDVEETDPLRSESQ
jgi:hypothetical protein